MLKHLFKLIWNKKKQNFLLLFEIFISFLVVFTVFAFSVFYYQNYSKPLGFEYKQVWAISYDNSSLSKNTDSIGIFYKNLYLSLKKLSKVEEVSYASANFPYSNSMMSTGLAYKGKKINRINSYYIDENYQKVWTMHLVAGRWHQPIDLIGNTKPIIINNTLKESVFGKKNAIGEYLNNDDGKQTMKIIGVVADTKGSGDFWPAGNAIFNQIDTGFIKQVSTILVKVRPNADATFESELYKFMTGSIKDANITIEQVADMREAKNKVTIIPMIIFVTVAGFLIINVALGLFGVLWYNINKRRSEIGLRRAIGASGRAVSSQLVAEAMILATLSLLLGCFFAAQFPILNVFDLPTSVYVIAMLLAVLFIYALVYACALYPGKQAAAIHPALALHEE
jgi:putative ABC transport system permease protein